MSICFRASVKRLTGDTVSDTVPTSANSYFKLRHLVMSRSTDILEGVGRPSGRAETAVLRTHGDSMSKLSASSLREQPNFMTEY